MWQKIWAGVSPSLPIPKLTHYIQFVKSWRKIWAGPSPPPLIWTKSKRTATFFLELSLTQSVRYVGIDLLGQLKSKEDSWSKQEPREDLTTLWAFGIVLGTARNCLCEATTVNHQLSHMEGSYLFGCDIARCQTCYILWNMFWVKLSCFTFFCWCLICYHRQRKK